MKAAKVIQGRIEEHGEGLGIPDENLVRARAREIAVTNGRPASQFNAADLAQAWEELKGEQNAGAAVEEREAVVPRDESPEVSHGKVARTRSATDEQEFADRLVQEGANEAEHERIREGNAASRRRDANFQDQLPDEEP